MPYDSQIFVSVQSGDLDGTRELLMSDFASIDAVDPYGLGLLYVSGSVHVIATAFLTNDISTLHTTAGEAPVLLLGLGHARPYLISV